MPIIALVGNKGGAGKTTLTMNLAAALARRGSTVVLDADPQGSALQWRAISGDANALPAVIDATSELEPTAREVAAQHSHLVIDCPPSVNAIQTHAALRISDLALIPVQPSPVDLWATVHISHAIERAREKNPRLCGLLIINQIEARTTLSSLVREALAELELPVAATAIRRRAIYRTSALEGKSVLEMGRRGAVAASEVDQLINEVMAL
ncbi:MAG: AAA family ATPase [Thiogranum sp.]|nr:AAA family ATPase [Thiogranum sp.]